MDNDILPAMRAEIQAAVQASESRLEGHIGAVEKRLDKRIDRVAAEIVRTQGQMREMKGDLISRIDQGNSRILQAIDELAGKTKDQDRRVLVFDQMFKDGRTRLDNHESRIRRLESGSSRLPRRDSR